MRSTARESYLVTEVMTATPQKLQLMLIEAAIRSTARVRRHWQAEENEEAVEALIHAQEIIGELLAGLNHEVLPELSKRVASVYLFVFRSLMEAGYARDETKLDAARRVLEIERETWRRVCEELGSTREKSGPAPGLSSSAEPAAPPAAAASSPPPALLPEANGLQDGGSGLSLEA